jgi:GNAT superfamily N-acetyltransferase
MILEGLPEWFGIPEAINGYVEDAASPEFRSVVAREGDRTVGIALVARHFRESAEVHLIAVARDYRGRGVGKSLIGRIFEDLTEDGCQLLSVHTVGPSFEDAAYEATRAFYRSVGFIPLEEHHGLDWSGPTLILVRPLSQPKA